MMQKQFKRRPKSWKGCTICRAAKRKCSEEQPRCAHCERNGLDCQYDLNVRFRVEEFTTVNEQVVAQKSRKLRTPELSTSEDQGSGTGLHGNSTPFDPVSSVVSHQTAASSSGQSLLLTNQDTLAEYNNHSITLPRTSEKNPRWRTIIPKQPTWPDVQVDPVDNRYFRFFLLHMSNIIVYTDLFPAAINEIFIRIPHSDTLRHTVLSISSHFVDGWLQRPLTRVVIHKQRALASLQHSISTGDITEDLAIAICLMLFMDVFTGRSTPQAHLRGFYLVLQQLQVESTRSGIKPSPILTLIRRIAIKMDLLVATIVNDKPVFPPLAAENNCTEKTWVLTLSKDGRSADLALAMFTLDNLYHRSNHWAREGGIVRASPEYLNDPEVRQAYESKVQERGALLRLEHANWLLQPSCAMSMQMETFAQLEQVPVDAPTFLDYPPLIIYDRTFCLILNQWRSQYLFFAFIGLPYSLHQHSPDDLNQAIEICRTHAALAIQPSSPELATEFFVLLTAGHTFSGTQMYQREFKWVFDRIAEMSTGKNPVLSQFQHFIDRVKVFNPVRSHEPITLE